MMTHEFESTGEAYDATQTEDAIKDGDLLLIPSERVVGIADTWPVAVTVEFGKLHTIVDGATLAEHFADNRACRDAIEKAKQLARHHGWPIRE